MNFYSSHIQKGSTGDDVKKWQQYLNSYGYDLAEDGIFGDATKKATYDFQLSNGLTADGIVGDQTWSKAGFSYYGVNNSTGSGNSAPTLPTFNTTATDKPVIDTTSWDATTKGAAALGDYNSAKADLDGYKAFVPTEYTKGKDVLNAENALNDHLANEPEKYTSKWSAQLDALMNQIMGREKFSYNMNEDPIYQQHREKYIQQGKLAMGDTMGQAAAMTGGYGNSWAQSVGQQAYQQSLDNLNDIVPELYAMALDKYTREGQDLLNQYGLVMDREDQDYGRYRDTLGDWQTDRNYLQGVYDNALNFDYGKHMDEQNMEYQTKQDEYQALLDKLGIARDDYYSGGDVFRTEQANKNNEAWKEYQAAEEARQYENSLLQQGYQNEYDAYWDDKNYAESVRQHDNQMALDWAKYNESVRQYNDTMAFNKAQANKNTTQQNPQQPPVQEETTDMYAEWDGLDWEEYFSSIRKSEGQSAAEAELDRMNKAGLIPKNMVTYASSGARGGKMGH